MIPAPEKEVRAFLDDYESRVRPLRIRSAEAQWSLARTGDEALLPELEAVQKELADLHADASTWRRIEGWLADPALADPSLRRQAEVLRCAYLERQAPEALRNRIIDLEIRVEQAFTTHRAELEGVPVSDNELDRILKEEADPERRRRAWEATRDVGRVVADRVRELARLRNEVARGLGFPDYRHLALSLQEFDVPVLDALLDGFEEQTRAPYANVKADLDRVLCARFGVAPPDLRPWHYPQRFHQSVPRSEADLDNDAWFPVATIARLTRETFAGIGHPVEEIWDRSDLLPRAGKNQHAFCIGVDSPRDVRVLCNLAPTERWMGTSLHEFGHAAYEAGLPESLPWPLRTAAHTFTTEAVAMWFGRLTGDPTWLARAAGLPQDRAARARDARREDQLTFARWGLTVSLFERELYRDPDQDLDARWWEIVSRLQGLTPPPGRRSPDWAAKVHVACYPAYYQNYLLGEVFASQIDATLVARTGTRGGGEALGHAATGALFRHLFALGASRTWGETVREVTGEALDPRFFRAQFLAGRGEGAGS
ncbi:M2 family metallopeptidase [Myxococcota bacterium]|nr:M2 family metallopeptidase [Myxococcota bacterium]